MKCKKLMISGLAVTICASLVTMSASSADPALWLSQARAAIGGDVAKESVASLRIRGSKRRHLGRQSVDLSWEAFWEAPDKFLQVETQTQTMGPMGSVTTTRRSGFNGDQEIAETISDFPTPPRPRNKPNALVPVHKRALTQLLLPLLASDTLLAGIEPFTIASDATVPARPGLNLVTFSKPDGTQMHLWLDATTHLPSLLTSMDSPIVVSSSMSTMTITTTERVPAGQSPTRTMPMPPPIMQSPPAPVPGGGRPEEVLWEMRLSDYRSDKGVTWPRRITLTLGGKVWEEWRIGRYEVNPKINPRTFKVSK